MTERLKKTPLLLTAAILFTLANGVFAASWTYYVRFQPLSDFGAQFGSAELHAVPIARVFDGSPAAKAGLQPGDRIIGVSRVRLDTLDRFFDKVTRGRPGDHVSLTIARPGEAQPIEVEVTLAPYVQRWRRTPAQQVVLELLSFYPLYFAPVALAVLFLRLRERDAWLLALLFAGLATGGYALPIEARMPAALRHLVRAHVGIINAFLPAVFYYFFAVFPVESPLERRTPRLKKTLLAAGGFVILPGVLWALLQGHSPLVFARHSYQAYVFPAYALAGFAAGLTSLAWNAWTVQAPEARKKIRVIFWGTAGGLLPQLLLAVWVGLQAPEGRAGLFQLVPFWLWVSCVSATLLLPLSFAYAVVKHRVMGISLMLRLSARYILVQRGFTFVMIVLAVVITLGFVNYVASLLEPGGRLGTPASITLGVAFGVALVWSGARLHSRVARRIDRLFFRSQYDAGQILINLAEKTQTVNTREELASLLEHEFQHALHPLWIAIYLEDARGELRLTAGAFPQGGEKLPPDLPVLEEAKLHGRPIDCPPAGQLAAGGKKSLRQEPHCLVPMLDRQRALAGAIILGPRRSEEAYSASDKRLLASVANQAGIALGSIRLAEEIARRMEAQQRAEREMQIARQVQARLFPQQQPPLATLDYAGRCMQTRAVGGDYFDFLSLSPTRLGVALGDISGKGMSAALLMANLQANLRSQITRAITDLPGLLQTVNRLFYDSTELQHFATFFFGDYDDETRRLRYANCGHPAPVLVRAGGAVERLHATASVLGMFADWEVEIEETCLAPDDLLVIFSDGVSEAMTDEGEEFGDERLVQEIQSRRNESAPRLLDSIIAAVETFSGSHQEDDVTLVVARGKP